MLNQTVQDALNKQIQYEQHAAHVYLSMSAYFEAINLAGCAHWMRKQSEEEVEHAMKIFDFVNDRGGRVQLQAIDAPPTEFASVLEVFEKALAHEQKVTGLINQLYELAIQEKDYPTQVMLQWFIDEQVEEEKNVGQVIEQLKMIGTQGTALYMFDRQLAARKED